MRKFLLIAFLILLPFLQYAQPCTGSSLNGPIPTKCFEILSILVDACDGSNEGQNEMIRLKIGPVPVAVSSITVPAYTAGPGPQQSVNWGSGASNPFRGWDNITSVPANQAKINTLNASIVANGKCGVLIPLNSTSNIPAGANVLIITSTAFNPAAQSFANLMDTLYVMMQVAGNSGGHFANYGNTGTRRLILLSGTCGDSVTYTPNSLLKQNLTLGAEDGGTVNFDFAGNDTYTNYGCAIPIIPITVSAGTVNPSYCSGSVLNLAGSVSGTTCYVWQPKDTATGKFSDTTLLTSQYTIKSGYTGAVTLYLKIRNYCATARDSVSFSVTPSTVSIDAGRDTSLCNKLTLALNGTSTTSGTITWVSRGAGSFSSTSILNPVYTPAATDTGNIYLVMSQNTSCGLYRDSLLVRFSLSSNAAFTLSDTVICLGSSPAITMTPLNAGGTFSGNNYITGNTCNPPTAGLYTIKYKVGTGVCADSVSKTIRVAAKPVGTFVASDTVACLNGPSIALTPTQTGGTFSGTNVSGSTFNPVTLGVFQVKYVNRNGACADSSSVTIRVTSKPNAAFTTSDSILCIGNSPILLSPLQSGGTFSGSGITGNTFSSTFTGVYSLKYKINLNGCVDSTIKLIRVANKPNATFSVSDTGVCVGSPAILLNPTTTGGIFYSGSLPLAGNSFNPALAGKFQIKYLINQAGCIDSSLKVINVYTKPNPAFTIDDTLFCLNDPSGNLLPTTPGGVFVSSYVNGLKFLPAAVGVFPILYRVSNGACKDSSTINVRVAPLPKAAFTFTPTQPFIKQAVQFTSTSQLAVAQVWMFNVGLNNDNSSKLSPTYTYDAAGKKTVLLTVISADGCIDTVSKVVEIFENDDIFIPNIFTPNGDGLNDHFIPITKGLTEMNYYIYNRWGELLFEAHNQTDAWDGRFKSLPCSDGVYFYIVEAKSPRRSYSLHGTVTVLR